MPLTITLTPAAQVLAALLSDRAALDRAKGSADETAISTALTMCLWARPS